MMLQDQPDIRVILKIEKNLQLNKFNIKNMLPSG